MSVMNSSNPNGTSANNGQHFAPNPVSDPFRRPRPLPEGMLNQLDEKDGYSFDEYDRENDGPDL